MKPKRATSSPQRHEIPAGSASPRGQAAVMGRGALTPLDVQQRYNVPEAAAYLRLAPSTTWLRIRQGHINAIREFGRTYIPGGEIARLSRLPEQDGAA